CAHRIEVDLEPACVIVCPVQAIVPGDLDDPNSRIARLVASQQVAVRKPEQGTQPKLFYLGADEASLTPAMQERGGRYAFAEGSRIPTPGQSNVAGFEPATTSGHEGVDLLRMARTVYDVAHPERPWGWKVSTYLWTKSIAAGVFLLAALGIVGGLASGRGLTARAVPLIGLVFLVLTTVLLVLDLKRPDRFHYLLFKPNWRSWLVWGGWILLAQGAVGTLWLLAGWQGNAPALQALAWPMLPLAAAAAGYSAFLFGQAEGRDFWQSPLVLPHLLVAAVTAGAASLLLAARALGSPDLVTHNRLVLALWVSLSVEGIALAAELFSFHGTQDSARATKILTRGPLRLPLWGGVAFCGIALPWALLLIPSSPVTSVAAAALALGGLWLWEDLWVRAGQAL
ncbi:MAG TPA: NrfD/PsrC family molybdoenzyme membrane anchor subunit, partial [Verrucomicrobiae bacterium]|nr:NrfD/PsrC family molybdoenzyme membrane anchor subunit [Verrucomicrobiae bacterium]